MNRGERPRKQIWTIGQDSQHGVHWPDRQRDRISPTGILHSVSTFLCGGRNISSFPIIACEQYLAQVSRAFTTSASTKSKERWPGFTSMQKVKSMWLQLSFYMWNYSILTGSYRYQQLELKHVEDHGCTPALEFRWCFHTCIYNAFPSIHLQRAWHLSKHMTVSSLPFWSKIAYHWRTSLSPGSWKKIIAPSDISTYDESN